MSRVSPVQAVFNGGELSPFMLGRFDHEVWGVSVLEMVGWVPRPQGPMEADTGFEFIELAVGPCRLITLEPYVTQAYVIEASDQLFRFYTNDALLLDAFDVAVEVVTPWNYAQILEVDYEPSNDVLYLFHGAVAPQLLVRTGADSFVLEDYEMLNGPFEDRNQDENLTVAADGTAGAVTLTASAALFEAGDVGGLFEIEFLDMAAIKAWEPGMEVTVGQLLQWGTNVYQIAAGAGVPPRTGTVAPTHTTGSEWDGAGGTDINNKGPYGVQLTYLHNGYGQLMITGFTSATEVDATVQQTLASTDPSWRWRFGAFSDRRGWPERGVIRDERMVLAKGDRRYLSQVGLLDDFSRFNEFGDIGDDQAIISPLSDPNPIDWLHSGAELFTGSAKNESVLRQSSAARGLAPGNTRNVVQTSRGSARVRPVDHDGRPIFVQRNGRRILLITESQYDRYTVEDLTRYADHIGISPIVEMAWQREPLQLLWGVREDGMLFGADMMPEESVLGFFRRPLGGGMLAKSIATATSPAGTHEDLWCVAEKNGAWRVMKKAAYRNAGESDANAIMCDAALYYDGAPETDFSMPHLAGETVEVVGDGAWLGSFVVAANGDLILDAAVSKAMAGVPFDAYVRLLPLEAGGDNGPAQFKMGRTARVYLRLQNSLGLRVTVDGAVNSARDIENQAGDTPTSIALPFMTRDVVLDTVGTHSRINEVRIDRIAPKQSTILAIGRVVEKAQR